MSHIDSLLHEEDPRELSYQDEMAHKSQEIWGIIHVCKDSTFEGVGPDKMSYFDAYDIFKDLCLNYPDEKFMIMEEVD